MEFFEFDRFGSYALVILSACLFEYCRADAPQPPITEQTQILWSLAPCQSAFWIPSTSSEFNQNWITYQYEGNPLSQFGECIFTLESDPNTRIEMIMQHMHEFGNGVTVPPPCLLIYDVRMDGSVNLLKKECNIVPNLSQFEMFSVLTETNLAIVSTTIRYGSFQIRARAVPKTFGFQTKPSVIGTPASPAVETPTSVVTIRPPGQPTTSTITTEKMPILMTVTPENPNSSPASLFMGSPSFTGVALNMTETMATMINNQQFQNTNLTRKRFSSF